MIILFDAIIPSPDLVTTPLHAIRGDFFPFLFFFGSLAIIPGGRGTIDLRAKRDYSYFDAIGLLC